LKHTTHAVDTLLARLPAEHPEKAALQARAVEYSQECGCTMGAAFLAGALLLALIYLTAVGGFGFRTGVASATFVLVAALSGKLTGLLLATLKLMLLRRSISQKLRHEGSWRHVHVH
jgi:hypothetical protein